MITVTALKWVPPFAQGQVRDHRVRWVLKEVGWPYQVRLLDTEMQRHPSYRTEQPFGQVPTMSEDGRAVMFETGAIVIDVASRSGLLLPADPDDRSRTICWVFAALNSIEPFFANLAEVDFFMTEKVDKERRRPHVLQMIESRLQQLEAALGSRDYLIGNEFTVADMMVASVMKIIGHTDIVSDYPAVEGHRDRCFARRAYREAIAEQRHDFAEHSPIDMKYPS